VIPDPSKITITNIRDLCQCLLFASRIDSDCGYACLRICALTECGVDYGSIRFM